MSYKISSNNFENQLLKDLLLDLVVSFEKLGADFYIIGATARDLILSCLHGENQPRRKTADVDIAIAIPDWERFDEVSKELCFSGKFNKDRFQKQRFWHNNKYMIDIVPFGSIAKDDNKIYWPPEESHAMSVLGFDEVSKSTLELVIDNEFTIRVASLPGVFILKIAAFQDRFLNNNKDADDMALILSLYLELNYERIAKEHPDIYDAEDFDTFVAGATLMGRDINVIVRLNTDTHIWIKQAIEKQISMQMESPLINQMIETHSALTYDKALLALTSMLNELSLID